jgi:hypothetical protein
MNETSDRFAEWDFEYAHNLWLTNPADWRSNAEASFLSAQVLLDAMRQRSWQKGGISGLVRTGHLESRYMLLMGLAFECLFKGLVVDHARRAGEPIPKDLSGAMPM